MRWYFGLLADEVVHSVCRCISSHNILVVKRKHRKAVMSKKESQVYSSSVPYTVFALWNVPSYGLACFLSVQHHVDLLLQILEDKLQSCKTKDPQSHSRECISNLQCFKNDDMVGKRCNSFALLVVFRRSFEAISLIISDCKQTEKKTAAVHIISNRSPTLPALISQRHNWCWKLCKSHSLSVSGSLSCGTFRSLILLSVAVVVEVDTSFSSSSSSSCWISLHVFKTWSLLIWMLSEQPTAVSGSSERDISVQTKKGRTWMHCIAEWCICTCSYALLQAL